MHTKFLVSNLEGKRLCGKPSRRWEDNIKMDFREREWGGVSEFIWLRIGTNRGIL
jgi:hypothetical protein